jgi:hypothetical protein
MVIGTCQEYVPLFVAEEEMVCTTAPAFNNSIFTYAIVPVDVQVMLLVDHWFKLSPPFGEATVTDGATLQV